MVKRTTNKGAARWRIVGAPAVGNTLQAVLGLADPEGNGPFTYRWQSSSNGITWASVGSNSPTYRITMHDKRKRLRLLTTYTDRKGHFETVTTAAGWVPAPPPVITLSLSSATAIAEDGSGALLYTFKRTGPTTAPLTAKYTVEGTATLGIDYRGIPTTPTTKSITFAAGSSTAILTVNPTTDSSIEPNETVALSLAAGTGYTIGTSFAVVGTIVNDDPRITLSLSSASVPEDGPNNLLYTFSRTGSTTSALTVNYTAAGTATLGIDYSGIPATPATKSITFAVGSATAILTVNPNTDSTVEPDETLALTLTAGAGYIIGTPAAVVGTITNDDVPPPVISPPVITLAVSPASVKEDSNSNLVFTFTRAGRTTEPLSINYTIFGSADATDYSGASPGNGKSIIFGRGSSTATLTIAPKTDSAIEANETVSLTLNTGTGYSIGTSAAVTGLITNDDSFLGSVDINWIQLLGGGGNEIGYAVATGPDGSIYVGGETDQGAWDGHTNRGGRDAFVSRFDQSGNRSWSRWFATDKNEFVRDLAVGKDGSLFVGGGTFGAIDGNASAGNNDGFLSKIISLIGKEWTIQFGGEINEYARRIATTPDDTGIYTIGYTRGFIGLPAAAPGEGGPDAYLMKVAKDKNVVWATRIVNGLDDWGMDITVGNDGSIYALGFAGSATNRYQAFLSKLNPSNGSLQWTKLIGGSLNEYGISLTTGNDGFIYAAISLDDADIAIHKYSADGALVWDIKVGSNAEDRASDLITGPDGALYLTGKTLGNLGGQTNKGQFDAFVSKISTQGQVEWTSLIGSSANDSGSDLAFSSNGDLILVGETSGNMYGKNSSGGSDVFIANLTTGQSITPLLAQSAIPLARPEDLSRFNLTSMVDHQTTGWFHPASITELS